MRTRSLWGKMLVVAALAASLVGVTAGTASAKPDRCAAIQAAWEDSLAIADASFAQGDYDNAYEWLDTAQMAQRNFKRLRCG